MEQLGKVINQVTKFVQERVPFPLGEQIHEFMPGVQVRVKDWKHDLLAPQWKGLYTVILTTPTAVKVAGIAPGIHHTRVKRANHADPENAQWTAQRGPTDPQEAKIILKKKKEKKIPDEPLQDEAAWSTPAAWPHQRAYSYTDFTTPPAVGYVGLCLCLWWMDFPGGCHHSTKKILNHSALFWDDKNRLSFLLSIIISPCSLGVSHTYSQ